MFILFDLLILQFRRVGVPIWKFSVQNWKHRPHNTLARLISFIRLSGKSFEVCNRMTGPTSFFASKIAIWH